MLAFAVAECGLTVDEFFRLSWYEWSLHVYKVKVRRKNDHAKWEGHASLTRELMALIVNVHPNRRKGAKMLKGKDFIPLSHDSDDKEDVKNEILSPEEVDEKLKKLMKNWGNGK
jgi:3-mercaptopyruvate sulfurtransferase SseA